MVLTCKIAKLANRGIQVHTFYIPTGGDSWTASTKANFEEIADQTDGTSNLLDINARDGSGGEQLTYLITTQILSNAGGAQAAKLIEDYESKFPRSYHRPQGK